MLEEEAQKHAHGGTAFVIIARALGVIGICLGAAEVGIGVTVFQFLTNLHVGAWYVGVSMIAISFFGLLCERSVTLSIIGCLAIVAIIIGLVGSIVDGIFWTILSFTRGCYSPYTASYYGDIDYESAAITCAPTDDSVAEGSCYCVQAGNSYCFEYTIADSSKYDCNDVLNLYTGFLHDSTILCSILTVGCFIYMIFLCTGGCMNCCSRTRRGVTVAFPPPQQQQQQQQQQFYPNAYQASEIHTPLITPVAEDYDIVYVNDVVVSAPNAPPMIAHGVLIEENDRPYNPNYNPKHDPYN